MTFMGNFEDSNGEVRGHEWDYSTTFMGRFEAINGTFRGH